MLKNELISRRTPYLAYHLVDKPTAKVTDPNLLCKRPITWTRTIPKQVRNPLNGLNLCVTVEPTWTQRPYQKPLVFLNEQTFSVSIL